MRSGYYLSDPSGLQVFPVGRRYYNADQSYSYSKDFQRFDLTFTTNKGKRWTYPQFSRNTPQMTYRVTDTELEFFETLDNAVDGQNIPFYFVPDVSASPLNAIYVRKEPNFQPREVNQGVVKNGVFQSLWDYTLILTQEPTTAQILA